MKRREFIALASAGTAGAVFPRLSRGAEPCLPPTLAVAGGDFVGTSCVSASPGSAPSWFVNMADGTWTTVAEGARIRDVLPSPVPHVAGAPDSPNSIMTAWTGGGVDQSRAEYILAANGGHADYPGNEAYALTLRSETPAWRRIANPTPNDNLGDVYSEGNGLYADGRPRAMHSTFAVYGDGRMWFPLQNSVTSGGGGSYNRVVAFNRNMLGPANSPYPWSGSSIAPWELYGGPFNSGADLSSVIFGVSAFDAIDHKVWALGGNSANYTVYWSVDTTGPSLGDTKAYQINQSFGHWGGWVVIAHDLRILIAGDHLRNAITVLDLNNPGASGAWRQVTNVTGSGYYNAGSGGAYIPANQSIAVGHPKALGTAFRKLKIPTTVVGGQTVYNASGQWVWTSINPSTGVTISNPAGNGSSYGKWNIIEDMGNGQSAIVVATDINAPTYVYKVPVTGL